MTPGVLGNLTVTYVLTIPYNDEDFGVGFLFPVMGLSEFKVSVFFWSFRV